MGCPRGETISAYIDGVLEHSAAEEIRRHMGVCETCVKLATEMVVTRELLKAQPSPSAPDGFLPRTRCRLDRQQQSRMLPLARLKPAFLGAAVFVIAAIGLGSWQWLSNRSSRDPLIVQCLEQYEQTAGDEPMDASGCVSLWDVVLGEEMP